MGAALLMGSCAPGIAPYEPAPVPEGAQVYFSAANPSDVVLTKGAASLAFDVTVCRVDDSAAMDIALSMSADTLAEAFKVPASVAFAAGAKEAKFQVSYDSSVIDFEVPVKLSIALNDEKNTTPYGRAVYTFTAMIPAPWVSLGNVKYNDAFFLEEIHEIEIEQNQVDPQSFRLVNPFKTAYAAEGPSGGFSVTPEAEDYLEFRIYKAGETLLKEVLTQDVVYYGAKGIVNTGIEVGYNDPVNLVFPGTFTKYPTQDSWFHNMVVEYQENGLPACVQLAPFYYMMNTGGWDHSQDDGYITMYFPGVEVKDYTVSLAYTGRTIDLDEVEWANGTVELGADVALAKVALFEGGFDFNTQVAAILYDAAENVQELTESGDVSFEMVEPKPGKYTLVAVSYDADGGAQDYSYAEFKYTPHGGGDVPEPYDINGEYEAYFAFNGKGYYWSDKLEMTRVPLWNDGYDDWNVDITNMFAGIADESTVVIADPLPAYFDEDDNKLLVATMYDVAEYTKDGVTYGVMVYDLATDKDYIEFDVDPENGDISEVNMGNFQCVYYDTKTFDLLGYYPVKVQATFMEKHSGEAAASVKLTSISSSPVKPVEFEHPIRIQKRERSGRTLKMSASHSLAHGAFAGALPVKSDLK